MLAFRIAGSEKIRVCRVAWFGWRVLGSLVVRFPLRPDNHHSPHQITDPRTPRASLRCCLFLPHTFAVNTRSCLNCRCDEALLHLSHLPAGAVPCRNTQPRLTGKHQTRSGTTPPITFHDGVRRLHNAMRKSLDTTVRSCWSSGNQWRCWHSDKVLCTNN